MNWLGQILTALLGWLTKLAKEDTTSEDAKPQTNLRDELRNRIDAHERRMREPRDSGPER